MKADTRTYTKVKNPAAEKNRRQKKNEKQERCVHPGKESCLAKQLLLSFIDDFYSCPDVPLSFYRHYISQLTTCGASVRKKMSFSNIGRGEKTRSSLRVIIAIMFQTCVECLIILTPFLTITLKYEYTISL